MHSKGSCLCGKWNEIDNFFMDNVAHCVFCTWGMKCCSMVVKENEIIIIFVENGTYDFFFFLPYFRLETYISVSRMTEDECVQRDLTYEKLYNICKDSDTFLGTMQSS